MGLETSLSDSIVDFLRDGEARPGVAGELGWEPPCPSAFRFASRASFRLGVWLRSFETSAAALAVRESQSAFDTASILSSTPMVCL